MQVCCVCVWGGGLRKHGCVARRHRWANALFETKSQHRITSHHLTLHHLTSSRSPCIMSPHLDSPRIISPRLASPRLASHHITSLRLASPRITSHHLTSHHLTSPDRDVVLERLEPMVLVKISTTQTEHTIGEGCFVFLFTFSAHIH